MNKNIFESIIGAAIIIFVSVLIGYVGWYKLNTSCYPIMADFTDVSGIVSGSHITVAGVKVGKVTSIALDSQSSSVKVEMCIQNDIHIPNDSSAVIASVSLIGEKNIKINFGSSEEFLNAGEEISYTELALGIESLINRFIFAK